MAVIRVSGHQGSGKTTLCKRLAEEMGYAYTYVGGIFREMAARQNKSIEQFYGELANDPEREKKVDAEIAASLATKDNQIIEGRMAPFWETPFKKINLLLTVDPIEGARRQQERDENKDIPLEEMARLSAERLANERQRYKSLYGIENHFDPRHFDIVIDTTKLSKDEVFEKAWSEIQIKLKHGRC